MPRRETIRIGDKEKVVYELSELNWNGIVGKVCLLPIGLPKCPKCRGKLKEYVFPIRLNARQCLKTNGMACRRCDTFYSVSRGLFEALETVRELPGNYTLDRSVDYSFDAAAASAQFQGTGSALCQVTLCDSREIRAYVIALEQRDCRSRGVLHYTSPLALKLLTAIYLRQDSVLLDDRAGEPSMIVRVRRAVRPGLSPIVEPSASITVIQESGGGFFSPEADIRQLDGLVFCASSGQLQVLPISFDRRRGVYYVDRFVFRRFCETYGIPILRYVESQNGRLNDLNEESLLHMLGYRVGQTGMGDAERQKLLGDIVDSGVMTVAKIVNHLSFLIRLNQNNPRRARSVAQWRRDLRFLEQYRRRHETFAFVRSLRGLD